MLGILASIYKFCSWIILFILHQVPIKKETETNDSCSLGAEPVTHEDSDTDIDDAADYGENYVDTAQEAEVSDLTSLKTPQEKHRTSENKAAQPLPNTDISPKSNSGVSPKFKTKLAKSSKARIRPSSKVKPGKLSKGKSVL